MLSLQSAVISQVVTDSAIAGVTYTLSFRAIIDTAWVPVELSYTATAADAGLPVTIEFNIEDIPLDNVQASVN